MSKQKVARKLASLILDSDSVLYSHWFKGIWNLVTDSLSRDVHLFSEKMHEQFLQFQKIACPFSDSSQFSHSTAVGKDLLFHYIDTAAAARQEAMVEATKDQ